MDNLTGEEMKVARTCLALVMIKDTSNSLLKEIAKDKPDIPAVKKLIAELDSKEYKRMTDKLDDIARASESLDLDFDF